VVVIGGPSSAALNGYGGWCAQAYKAQVIAVKKCDGDAFLQSRAQTGTPFVK
jgi:hypothetical protein